MSSGDSRTVLLEDAVVEFKRLTKNLEQHQIVVGERVYPQPCVYLVMHLIQMRRAEWEVDFDTLAAVSGASALLAYEPGTFMPKYANLHIGMDDHIAEATGFGYEWVGFDSAEEAWRLIVESVDSGRPLKGWHWENLLIAGYQDADTEADRKAFVVADGPDTIAEWWTWAQVEQWIAEWPHRFGRHTRRVPELGHREVALRVIEDLVAWSTSPPEAVRREFPKARFGLDGIEAYAADCTNLGKYHDWAACHDINPQWTLRNSTAIYLDAVAVAGTFPSEVSSHISAAAREYRAAYEDWCELYVQLGHSAPEGAGKMEEHRTAAAAAVRKGLAHERSAIQELREALATVQEAGSAGTHIEV